MKHKLDGINTLHMLKRIEELKESLFLYAANTSKTPVFTNLEWKLISECVRSLEPFEDITKKFSGHKSAIAEIIPLVASFKFALELRAMEKH